MAVVAAAPGYRDEGEQLPVPHCGPQLVLTTAQHFGEDVAVAKGRN